ncbi:MAG TPA: hypothetical protein VF166_06710 [Gemmatimonadaceae bacterium]
MKKSYETPTVASGDIVRETKSSGIPPEVNLATGPMQAPGSVGFHL